MRAPWFLLILPLVSTWSGAEAQTRPPRPAPHVTPAAKPEAPKALGKYDDWIAATHVEAGQTVCYAFTRPTASSPAVSGRGDVVLTITERSTGRDAVAISAGFAFAANASVLLEIDQNKLEFYTSQRNAFARDGHATVLLLEKGRQVTAHLPGPHNAAVVDTFNLRGLSAAYAAINKACPPK